MASPFWDKLLPFIRNYRLTASFLAFLTLLAFLQALFNFHASPQQATVHITSSHQHSNLKLTAGGILNGTTLWHAPAKFPQWIQFRFSEPVKMNRLEIMSQENSPQGEQHKRAPKTFKFMGKKNKEDWQELLSVENVEYETGGQWKQWEVKSKEKYTVFRLVITENNGDPSWLTIHQMRLDYK